MCGIAGILDYNGRANKIEMMKSMLRSISFRGPDESGIYHSIFACLGNVRLSIIDISGGQQPLSDSTGRYWIVFNGEIFNYKELRSELEEKGISFKTTSDTEVLIELFSIYGKKCLELLNGQFAFAIWDKKAEEIFIARDRVGIRPLYYNINDGVFSFASEIKSLLQQKSIPRKFNIESLSQIYTFWTTISPGTAFKNIYELSPGHCMSFSRNGLKVEKYWELSFDDSNSRLSLDEAKERLNEILDSAVSLRLRADV